MLTHLGVNFLDGLPRFWGWGHLCHCSSFRGLCSLCMICGKLWLSSGQLANQETMPDFLSNSKGFGPQFITWTSAILVENRIVFWHFLTINFHYAIDTGHQWLLSAINGHQHGHQQAISSQVFLRICYSARKLWKTHDQSDLYQLCQKLANWETHE